jgi:hypothetical protein
MSYEISEAVHDLAELPVEENPPVINDDDALAQGLDVGHIMARKQNGGLMRGVVAAQEFADGFLRNDVQPDGRLVEEQDFGLMEQRSDQFHLPCAPPTKARAR